MLGCACFLLLVYCIPKQLTLQALIALGLNLLQAAWTFASGRTNPKPRMPWLCADRTPPAVLLSFAPAEVPPGRYMSQGLVRICPQGFFRANYEAFDAAVAQKCLPCNPGITTDGPGAKSAAECRRVLPGYGIINIPALNSTADIPALPSTDNSTTGLPNATLCALAKYSAGGYCAACPSGTVTRVEGAQSVEECGEWLCCSCRFLCLLISSTQL